MFLLGGGRRRNDREVLEQALKDVDFWKEELEHAVEEKNQWRDKSIAAQKQLREMEQLKKQIVALREEKYHTGKQYDRALQEVQRLRARKAEQVNQGPEDQPAGVRLVSEDGSGSVRVMVLEERVAELQNENDLLHRQNALLRASEAAFQQEAKVLRDELRNQDGINEVTAEETTKLLLEISRLQQQNVQLRTDVMHRDEMLRIIQSQLAELNINADESDLLREDGTPGSQTPVGGSSAPSPKHRRSDSGTLAPSSPLAALQGLLNLRTISFDAVLAAQRKLNITSAAATSEDAFSAPLQMSPRRSLSSGPLRAAHTSNSSNSPQRRPSPPHQPPPAFQLAHKRGASLDVLQEESHSNSGRCSSEGQSSLSISLGSALPTARIASLQASAAAVLPESGPLGNAFPAGPLAEALEAHLAECASQQGSTPLVLLQQEESLQHAGSGGSISFGHGHSHRTLSLTMDRAMSDTSEASVHQPTPPAAEAAKQPIQMHFEAAEQQQALQASMHREQAAAREAAGAARDSTSLPGAELPGLAAAEEECCSEAGSSSGSSCRGGARKLQLLPQPAPGDVDVRTTLALDQACDSSQQLLGSPKSSLSGKSSPSVSPTKAGSQAGSALLHKQAPELYYSAQNLAVQAALSQGSKDSGLAQLKSRFQAVQQQQQQSPSQQSSAANPTAADSADEELLPAAGIMPLRVRVLASAGARTITEGSPHRYGSVAISNSGSNTVDDGGESPSNTPTSKLQQQPEEPEADAVTPKPRPSTAFSSPGQPAVAGSSKATPAASPSSAPLPKVSIDFATTGIPQRQMALAALAGNLKVDIVPQITRRLSNRVRDTGSESPSAAAAAAAAAPASPEVAAAPAVQVPRLQKVASMRAAFEKGM